MVSIEPVFVSSRNLNFIVSSGRFDADLGDYPESGDLSANYAGVGISVHQRDRNAFAFRCCQVARS